MCSISEAWSGSIWKPDIKATQEQQQRYGADAPPSSLGSNNSNDKTVKGSVAPYADASDPLSREQKDQAYWRSIKYQQQLQQNQMVIQQLEDEMERVQRRLDKQLRTIQQQDQALQMAFYYQQQQQQRQLYSSSPVAPLPAMTFATVPSTTSSAWYQDWSFWIIFALLLVVIIILVVHAATAKR